MPSFASQPGRSDYLPDHESVESRASALVRELSHRRDELHKRAALEVISEYLAADLIPLRQRAAPMLRKKPSGIFATPLRRPVMSSRPAASSI